MDALVDTEGRLRNACEEALLRYPSDVVDAWRYVGAIFGHQFLQRMVNDRNAESRPEKKTVREYKDPISPERMARRAQLQQVVRSKYKTSAGIPWSDVRWSQLHELSRDGAEAQALLKAKPQATPNDTRTVGDVLGIGEVDKIIEGLRTK